MKSIFITGGARGIGLATAQLFLSKGWRVGIFDSDQEELHQVETKLCHDALRIYTGSVLDQKGIAQAIDDFSNKHGMDVLLNNAGILEVGEFDEQPLDTHLAIADVNLKGVIIGTYEALPYLKKSGDAKIINMSSASAIYGNPELSIYAATKSAIMSLTEGWNIAFRKHGISVSDVLPIYVRTRIVEDYHHKYRKLDLRDVSLTPEHVATAIWKASHSRRVNHYVGRETKIYARLVKWLPEAWLSSILRRVLGYKD